MHPLWLKAQCVLLMTSLIVSLTHVVNFLGKYPFARLNFFVRFFREFRQFLLSFFEVLVAFFFGVSATEETNFMFVFHLVLVVITEVVIKCITANFIFIIIIIIAMI